MGSFSDFLENELLDHVLGNSAYVAPSTVYIALSTADPTDTGAGMAEPSGFAYARQAVTNNLTNWPAAVAGAKSNFNSITFPEATGNWGTITHFAIFDAVSGGNMLMHGALTVAKAITSGDVLQFPATSIAVSLA